jgi:hypothetical protein
MRLFVTTASSKGKNLTACKILPNLPRLKKKNSVLVIARLTRSDSRNFWNAKTMSKIDYSVLHNRSDHSRRN